MLKKVIHGWTHAPGAPKGWNPERDGECGSLPIRVIGKAGTAECICESAWEPTPNELAALNAGGQVVLRVIGWQVPVALYVEERREDGPPVRVNVPPRLSPRARALVQETIEAMHAAGDRRTATAFELLLQWHDQPARAVGQRAAP